MELNWEIFKTFRLGIQVDSKLKFHAHTILLATLKSLLCFALSVNLLSVKILMLLLDYTQLLCASSLNIIMYYGDLLTYLIIDTQGC